MRGFQCTLIEGFEHRRRNESKREADLASDMEIGWYCFTLLGKRGLIGVVGAVDAYLRSGETM